MKAIETRYDGYRFRSRTEARWAVYFNAMGMEYEYEKEGFILSDSDQTKYLPDFWLPREEMWAEVKGGEFTWPEVWKCSKLVEDTGFPCIFLIGTPKEKPYFLFASRPALDPLPVGEWCYLERGVKTFTRGNPSKPVCMTDIFLSVRDARSARFEHGEVCR